ncbi:MAG: hypothetical protein J6Q13_02425 [Clostridia bacterium]|nr:hypothetical protein [Clostridia bacterium]
MSLLEKMIKFKTENLYVCKIGYYDQSHDRFVSIITRDAVQFNSNGRLNSVLTNKEYITTVEAKNKKEDFVFNVALDLVPYNIVAKSNEKFVSKSDVRKLIQKLNSHFHRDEILIMRAVHKYWEYDALACLNDNAYYVWNRDGIDEDLKLGELNENGDFVFWNGGIMQKGEFKKLVDAYPQIMGNYKRKILTPKQISKISEDVMYKSWNDENMV